LYLCSLFWLSIGQDEADPKAATISFTAIN
jgi:hypothetical protein